MSLLLLGEVDNPVTKYYLCLELSSIPDFVTVIRSFPSIRRSYIQQTSQRSLLVASVFQAL